MAGTVLRLGWSDPRTDRFGAHPLLGAVIDLNDGVTFTLLDDTLELTPPPREIALAGNPRTQGERAVRAIYRRNRRLYAQLTLGPMASYSDLIANVRALIRWIDAAPATPITIQWQPPNATAPVYLDVVGAAHALPADERDWLRLQVEPIELVFVVRPGLRGDRVTLSNLVSNPGFEAPAGPGVQVFSDNFATTNAYTTISGGPPTVSGNVLILPANTQVRFGSPSWAAVNQWQLRFFLSASASCYFYLHYTDANNHLRVDVNPTGLQLNHMVAGTLHTLATATVTVNANTVYWLVFTQFPSAPSTQCDAQASFYSDSSGSIGSLLASLGPAATFDGVTALSGYPLIQSGSATLNVTVSKLLLFGPGGWAGTGMNGSVAEASLAWEQTTANTYPGGATTSYGAARIDLPPAGTVNAYWENYSGGAPGGTSAMAATTGQTVAASVYVKSSGLSGTAAVALVLREWDTNGNILRSTTLQAKSGNQAAWTQLSGTVALGASTAYCSLLLQVSDAVSGASANGTVWFDNTQCWNVTTTGQQVMPYCELRFPQSPAQLLVTGLVGDLPAPASLAWGTFLASWPVGSTLSYAIGRRGQAAGSAANALLVGGSHGVYGAAGAPISTAVLDGTSYGGYYITAAIGNGWNPRAFSFAPSDALGVYHLIARLWTSQVLANLPNVIARVLTQQKSAPWYGATSNTDQLGAYYGPYGSPISASSTWTPSDAGQVNVPALPAGALNDLTQNYLTPRPQWGDTTGGGSTGRTNWQLLLPIDGSLVMGLLNNPSNASFTVTNEWLWVYHDGLLLNRAGIGDGAATTYSLETIPAPNPAHAGGGPGTQGTGVINVNSGADAALTLDPTLTLAATSLAAGGAGVNQLAGYVADNNRAVLPLHAEIAYSPLYLYPR